MYAFTRMCSDITTVLSVAIYLNFLQEQNLSFSYKTILKNFLNCLNTFLQKSTCSLLQCYRMYLCGDKSSAFSNQNILLSLNFLRSVLFMHVFCIVWQILVRA